VDKAEHEEHQEDDEQEQRHRRDVAGALALNIVARQLAGAEQQRRQRLPGLAIEMRDAVQKLLADVEQAAVEMRLLPAIGAEIAGQGCVTIGALAMGTGGFGVVAGARRIERRRDQPGIDQSARCIEISADSGSGCCPPLLPRIAPASKRGDCDRAPRRLE
jgi:hypothetical protein